MMKLFRFMTMCLVWLAFAAKSQAVTLVENGQKAAVIVIDNHANDVEKSAAQELQAYIAQMSGAALDMRHEQPGHDQAAIMIGQRFLPDNGFDILKKGNDPSSFTIVVKDHRVYLGGLSAEGTQFAVYEFLEMLGVRWYFPGELGTVVPTSKTITVDDTVDIQVPSFKHRYLQSIPTEAGGWKKTLPWCKKRKLGGMFFNGRHGIPCTPVADVNKEPELFALVNGQRQGPQMCLSNPELLKRAITGARAYLDANPDKDMFGMGPEDGSGFCECEKCKALDADNWDAFNNYNSMTDRYIWFFNQVLDEVHKTHPGKKLAFYIYHNYQLPPVKYTPNKHIVGAFAPINLCRIHGMSNPLCPDRSFYKYLMEEWGKLLPELFERGYYYNLAAIPVPFSKIHAVRDECAQAYKNNVQGWRVESDPSWASCGVTLYIASELMWNVHADVDALLNEFYTKFFGPASQPMGQWLDMVDDAYANTDAHAGSTYDLPIFFPPEKIRTARTLLARAEALAKDQSPYNQRVEMFKVDFDMLDHYLNMWQARIDCDFKKSHDQYMQCQNDIDILANQYLLSTDDLNRSAKREDVHTYRYYAPYICYPYAGFLKRFFYDTVQSGYERTVLTGQLVSKLDRVWDFQLDYDGIGQKVHWFADGKIGGNWHTIDIDKSWSDQGYYYYKGDAWYRTEVAVSDVFEERKLYLWFGGVDELARVWINGELLGESFAPDPSLPGVPKAFAPFEFDITEHVRFDRPNTIAVKITNGRVDEIGTGGIMSPVMIWSPKKLR